jgi:hypothetical protein
MAKSTNFANPRTQSDQLDTIKKRCFLVYYIKIDPHESEEALWKKVGVFLKFGCIAPLVFIAFTLPCLWSLLG